MFDPVTHLLSLLPAQLTTVETFDQFVELKIDRAPIPNRNSDHLPSRFRCCPEPSGTGNHAIAVVGNGINADRVDLTVFIKGFFIASIAFLAGGKWRVLSLQLIWTTLTSFVCSCCMASAFPREFNMQSTCDCLCHFCRIALLPTWGKCRHDRVELTEFSHHALDSWFPVERSIIVLKQTFETG